MCNYLSTSARVTLRSVECTMPVESVTQVTGMIEAPRSSPRHGHYLPRALCITDSRLGGTVNGQETHVILHGIYKIRMGYLVKCQTNKCVPKKKPKADAKTPTTPQKIPSHSDDGHAHKPLAQRYGSHASTKTLPNHEARASLPTQSRSPPRSSALTSGSRSNDLSVLLLAGLLNHLGEQAPAHRPQP